MQREASVEALQITQWNSYKDVHGKLTKWVDSTKVKVALKGSPAQRQKVLDSIR
ncbi:hypothetical protein SAMN05421766_10744 [Zobellia uliginosa]|uniref:Uncharacterized protein n=1 Tax=Zobellia uliginosa TaxID=143224 RepID=A0ABY1L0H0_9FLAO|nr:hypothetical protein SAMN05421766_10744 [Zobellia uliginosa]